MFDQSKLKAFADDKLKVIQMAKFVLDKMKKHCWKRGKCWLPAFFSFPSMFSKGLFVRVIKSPDCVVRVSRYSEFNDPL